MRQDVDLSTLIVDILEGPKYTRQIVAIVWHRASSGPTAKGVVWSPGLKRVTMPPLMMTEAVSHPSLLSFQKTEWTPSLYIGKGVLESTIYNICRFTISSHISDSYHISKLHQRLCECLFHILPDLQIELQAGAFDLQPRSPSQLSTMYYLQYTMFTRFPLSGWDNANCRLSHWQSVK